MRKTTAGRNVVHIPTERVTAFIVRAPRHFSKFERRIDVKDPGYGERNAKVYDPLVKKAYDEAHDLSVNHRDEYGNGMEMLITPVIMKTSRPHRLQ